MSRSDGQAPVTTCFSIVPFHCRFPPMPPTVFMRTEAGGECGCSSELNCRAQTWGLRAGNPNVNYEHKSEAEDTKLLTHRALGSCTIAFVLALALTRAVSRGVNLDVCFGSHCPQPRSGNSTCVTDVNTLRVDFRWVMSVPGHKLCIHS